ncbi:permease [bacterium]|nr:permease [bacterium]NCQ55441.1 permease [Candidatus Parcubacteria bacterium]NCS67803.1 permease [Candidatus Peregrinibacteria bacterium]NCS96383.1 permease [bacterium]
MEYAVMMSVIGAGLSIGLAGAGSSIGIGTAGTKGAGVFGENPNLFGKVLLMMLLPGSQGIYGLLIAILILNNMGALTGEISVTAIDGMKYFGAGIAMGLTGLFSGWFQGKVAAAGIAMLPRAEELSGKFITQAVVVETYAIFGLLIAVLLVLL